VEVVENVAQALLEVHPTVLAAVPRFFEKIYARLMEQGSKSTGAKRKIFDFAMADRPRIRRLALRRKIRRPHCSPEVGHRRQACLFQNSCRHRRPTPHHSFRRRSAFQRPLRIFLGYRNSIYQGYGLTETSPVLTSNHPQNRSGSSGRPIPNVQLRIADDGEILAKGPCVMQGYFKSPESTREVLFDDGWFKTGDIGYLDKDNYLFITDRKKDLLKTAAGKFVAPQPIENTLKTSPYILNAMVVGDQRKFVVALIVPNPVTVSANSRKTA